MICKKYIGNGSKLDMWFWKMEDADWNVILEEMHDEEHPLCELKLEWRDNNYEPCYIEFIKCIGSHTTSVRWDVGFSSILSDRLLPLLLEALKDNRSIKHFDLKTTCTFKQAVMTN